MTLVQEFDCPEETKIQSGDVHPDADHKCFLVGQALDGHIVVYLNNERIYRSAEPMGAPASGVHTGDGKLWIKARKRNSKKFVRIEVPGWTPFTTFAPDSR